MFIWRNLRPAYLARLFEGLAVPARRAREESIGAAAVTTIRSAPPRRTVGNRVALSGGDGAK